MDQANAKTRRPDYETMRPSTGTFRLNSISAIIFVALLVAAALSFLFYSIPMAGVLAMAGVLSILSVKIPSQWERVVVLRLGKFRGMRGPGLFFIIPFVDTVPYWIDLRLVATPFRAEQTLTKDNVPVDVDAVCFWKVTDPQRAALEVVNYYEVISWASQTALRDVIGKTELSEMLVGRELIDIQLKELIDHRTEGWGIHVQSVELRDVIIPGALQDAMSIQAQAERERQARIILGDSETQIAQKFEEAAKSYVNNPTALHLRAMNMLYEGLKERGALIIVPSTAVETMGLGAIMGMTSLAKITQTNEKPITGEKG